MKIVYAKVGPFRLSASAVAFICAEKQKPAVMSNVGMPIGWHEPLAEGQQFDDSIPIEKYWDMERSDPALVAAVETLAIEAGAVGTILSAVEVPDTHDWYIVTNDQGGERLVMSAQHVEASQPQ